jgi:TonB family protein
MTAYIIKSSLSLLLLFGLYWFLLRKEKLFVFNRFFLVASVVFSLVVPFISIPVNFQTTPGLENFIPAYNHKAPEIITTDNVVQNGVNSSQSYIQKETPLINISLVLFLLYFSGVLLFLIRFLRNLFLIVQRGRLSEKISLNGYQIILTNDQTGPCCFFDHIFLNRDDYHNERIDKDLLNHEMEHARQSHTIDIILIELVKVFYWFNPVYLLYERAIRINHEYLADNGVISYNSDIKSYADKLLNFITCSSNMSLTSGSNNSFTKMRLIMMMKSHSGSFKYGTKIAITICMVTIFFILLSFKESKIQSSATNPSQTEIEIQQNIVKGIALGEDGKPIVLVTIVVAFPGITPTNIGVQTDSAGRFELKHIQKDASLLISGIGYKDQTLKPDFTSEMVIKMVKDPNYKMGVRTRDLSFNHEGENVKIRMPDDKNLQSLIVIDDKISNYKGEIILKRDDVGLVKALKGKEATDKYGEKGKDGVIEIITKKRAAELGLNTTPPASELKQTRDPYDFPAFQVGYPLAFQEWVAAKVKYPVAAMARKIEGWVSVNYTVNMNGSIGNIATVLPVNSILSDEVIRVIKSSPKWDLPKNKDTGKPFNSSVTLKFKLPDKIIKEAPNDFVEEMPIYPGGEVGLLSFFKNNTKYPEKAKAEKIEGNVIIRFIVSTDGNSEGISVLKGVHPLLDAEAIRVVSLLKGWKPGMHDGKPVNTWYMVPVNFAILQSNLQK